MDQKSIFITIAIILTIAFSGVAAYSFFVRSACSDINGITAFLGNQLRVNLIYVASSNSVVQKITLPKDYSVSLGDEYLEIKYNGFCKASKRNFVVAHDLGKVKKSETSSRKICLAASIVDCKKIIEICDDGEDCCSLKKRTCGNGM